MFRIGLILLFLVITVQRCTTPTEPAEADQPPALADTLVSIFSQLKEAAKTNKVDEFLSLLDTIEARKLRAQVARNGFKSLRTYIEHQFESWPDPDTLSFVDLVTEKDYARLALEGEASRLGTRQERVRWTFLLFRRSEDNFWRLSAMSSLESRRFDRYGTELTYLETDLPPRLRFPRIF